jgi:hypothetical protein
MPGVDDVLSGAKNAMNKANTFTKSVEGKVPSSFAVKAKPAATPAAPPKAAEPGLGTELGEKARNISDYANAPKMHKGGTVPGKKGEEVPIIAKAGEKVIPADKTEGRSSEYRKVFIARRQSRQDGGNTPVKGEAHDSKKAKKSGQPAAKEAGAHVKP